MAERFKLTYATMFNPPEEMHSKYDEMLSRARVRLLRKTADLIDERIFEMGVVMSLEVGKNRMEALGDVAETADLIRYACFQMEKNEGYCGQMGRDPLVGYSSSNI